MPPRTSRNIYGKNVLFKQSVPIVAAGNSNEDCGVALSCAPNFL